MNGRLFSMMMLFVALALALSLTVALAPDAGAQNCRPAVKDVEATTYDIPSYIQKVCCICIERVTIPEPDAEAVIGSESPASSTPYSSPSRWFCTKCGLIQ